MLSSKDKKQFSEMVKKTPKFVVGGHQGPDGDVIGSTLALALGLKQMGKKVFAYNRDSCPRYLGFLPKSSMVKNIIPGSFKGSVLITVDSGDLARLGEEIKDFEFGEVWCVDHHQSNTRFGKYNFIDVKAGSTGQVVMELLEACRGFKLTSDIANSVFCTLSTDTGSFRYQNASPEVFQLAAKLVSAGARPEVISQALYETYPARRLTLLGRILPSLKYEFNGQLAQLALTLDDLAAVGASDEDSEEFVNIPRGVVGVKVVSFFKEKAPGVWKVSLRARGPVNVLKIAEAFGGGGHKLAAGCTLKGQRDEVAAAITEKCRSLGYF